MHYVVCLHADRFYVACHRAAEGIAAETPVVVHRKRVVTDACPAAARFGVRRGATLNEAKSLAPDAVAFAYDPEVYAAPARVWHDRCLPFVGRIEVADPATVFADLSEHPDPSDIAIQLRRVLTAGGMPFRMGAGPARWIAKLAAGGEARVTDAEWSLEARRNVAQPQASIAPLPIARLTPIPMQNRKRLEFLGYRTIGEVAELPLDVLRRQFGLEAHTILSAANAAWPDPVQPNHPLDAVCRVFYPEGVVEDTLTLERCLSELSARLARDLAERESEGHHLELTLEHEGMPPTVLAREFTKPLHTGTSLRSALALLAGSAAETPIVSLRAMVCDLRPVQRRQRDLLGSVAAEVRESGAVEALRSLQTTFGGDAIRAASELAVARRARVMRAWSDVTGWR